MKKTFLLLTFLFASIIVIVMSSCAEDDNGGKPFILSDYLLGTWKSYKSVVYKDGQVFNLPISKDGDLKGAYMEVTLQKEGHSVIANWQSDEEGNVQWVEVPGTYQINGNTFSMRDSYGNVTQYIYDENSKNIYFKETLTDEVSESIIYIYFIKNTTIQKQ